jgi:hypothetical protein
MQMACAYVCSVEYMMHRFLQVMPCALVNSMATKLHALYQVMHNTYAAMYRILRNMFVF